MGVKIIDRMNRERFIWLEEAPNVHGLSVSPAYTWGERDERKPYTLLLRPEVVLQLARAMEALSPFQITRSVFLEKPPDADPQDPDYVPNSIAVRLEGRRDRDDYLLSITPSGYDPYLVRIKATDCSIYGELLKNYAYDLFSRCVYSRKLRLQARSIAQEPEAES